MKKITLLIALMFTAISFAQTFEITAMKNETTGAFDQTMDEWFTANHGLLYQGQTIEYKALTSDVPDADSDGFGSLNVQVRYNPGTGNVFIPRIFPKVAVGVDVVTDISVTINSDAITEGETITGLQFINFVSGASSVNQNRSNLTLYKTKEDRDAAIQVLSAKSYKKNNLNAFYNSSKKALIVGEATIEGNYSIVNILGQKLLRGKMTNEINVSSLKNGLYILSTDKGSLKFVKE